MRKNILIIAALTCANLVVAQITLDKHLPHYQARKPGIDGHLKSIGSDTLNNLMTLWAESFRKIYPKVRIEIEGKGSSTAPPALIQGSANLGPMSRKMKKEEIIKFEKKFGYKPTAVRVAVDALAVFVHKDAPIDCLSLDQVDAIFSKTRKHGYQKAITTWGDLGVKGAWATHKLSVYGRNSASGTYGFFKESALAKGDFADTVKEQPGSSAVVQAVASDRYAIGYSGIGYKTADVKALKLSVKQGSHCYEATAKMAYSKKYPLARFLYIYVNKKPKKQLEPILAEFFKYVLSYEGQSNVIKDGYFPLSAKVALKERQRLGITSN